MFTNNQNSYKIVLGAMLEKNRGNFDKALEMLYEAKEINPFNPLVYFYIGQINCVKKSFDIAVKNFLVFIHLRISENSKYNHADGHRHYSDIYSEFGYSEKQKIFFDNIKKFNLRNESKTPIIKDNIIVNDGVINSYCMARPPLQTCIIDDIICFMQATVI